MDDRKPTLPLPGTQCPRHVNVRNVQGQQVKPNAIPITANDYSLVDGLRVVRPYW